MIFSLKTCDHDNEIEALLHFFREIPMRKLLSGAVAKNNVMKKLFIVNMCLLSCTAFSSEPKSFSELFEQIDRENLSTEQSAAMIKNYFDPKKGHDINEAHEKYTALMAAAHMGDQSLVTWLIDKGINLNAKDDKEMTALMYAANQISFGKDNSANNKAYFNIIQYLVAMGANPEIKGGGDKTAEQHTLARGDTDSPTYSTIKSEFQKAIASGLAARKKETKEGKEKEEKITSEKKERVEKDKELTKFIDLNTAQSLFTKTNDNINARKGTKLLTNALSYFDDAIEIAKHYDYTTKVTELEQLKKTVESALKEVIAFEKDKFPEIQKNYRELKAKLNEPTKKK